MKFKAKIYILPLDNLLDPQGKAVNNGLHTLGIHQIHDVRIGKFIILDIRANSVEQAREIVKTACEKLLVNLIMEKYEFEIIEIK